MGLQAVDCDNWHFGKVKESIMRIGRKFLALTGLCGVVLTCLIGLAEDDPSSDVIGEDFLGIPPAAAPPQTEAVPQRYSRSKESENPQTFEFQGGFPQPPGLPTQPPGPEQPPHATPEGLDHLVNAQYKEPGSAPPQPPEENPPSATVNMELPPSPPLPNTTADAVPFNPNVPEVPSADIGIEVPITPPVAAATSPAAPVATPAMNVASAVDFQVPPTTGPQSTQVTLEWVKQTEINVGQECQCDLVVKNTGSVSARNVTVQAMFPPAARLLPTTKPAPTPQGKQLQWTLGELAPKQAKVIQIHLIPTNRENLNASAVVHFTSAAATVFKVQEPLLQVALKGPKEVQVGDPASQIIQVSNPGTGTARNVEIKALIPEGLEHPQGKQLTMAIGSLNPGETRMVRLALSAVSGGNHAVKVLAEAKLTPESAPYLRELKESEIRIIAPSVKVVAEGPGLRYKNRNATYRITVANDGTAVSNNVRVMHRVPEGFQFVSATEGGKFDALSKTVAWFVGRIEPGQTSEMSVTLEAVKLGDFEHQVSAITDQGARSETRIPTKIDGIASLTLEVNDLNDPVEIGVETAYEIHVKNQGTKHAQNVAVACELPAGVELVDVDAPAKHNLQGRVVVFQALPMLDADKAAVYRIIVRGTSDGYQRFRARLASDSIQEPLLVEELTKFYGE